MSDSSGKRRATFGTGDATDVAVVNVDVGEGRTAAATCVLTATCSAAPSGTHGLASPELLAGEEYPVDSTALGDSTGKVISGYSFGLGPAGGGGGDGDVPAATPASAGRVWSPLGGERTRNDSSCLSNHRGNDIPM